MIVPTIPVHPTNICVSTVSLISIQYNLCIFFPLFTLFDGSLIFGCVDYIHKVLL